MKGRLDRFGQLESKLNLEYFIISDTIEEANLIRLDIANNFHANYIMPLAEFYDIALERKTVDTLPHKDKKSNGKPTINDFFAKKMLKQKNIIIIE